MLYAIITVLILIADQGVKFFAARSLADVGVLEFIPGFLQLQYVENTGAAFGLFQNLNIRWFIVAVTVIFAVIVVLALNRRWITGTFGRWMAVLVLGGALGNVIDRVIHEGGYVVDMFEFTFKIFGNSFPVFNIADIFITVGGILFCIYVIFHRDPEHHEEHVVKGRDGSAAARAPRRRSESIEDQSAERRPRIANSDRPVDDKPVREIPARPAQAPPQQRRAPAQQQRQAPAAQPRPASSQPRQEGATPQQGQPRPRQDSPAPKPRAKPKTSSDSFDLEDILNEFRD